jgi:hypothetical protein
MKITNNDLYKSKFSIEVLEENINNLDNQTIISTQILTADYCIKYILDEKFGYITIVEDTYICDSDVLYYQKHLTQQDLINARIKLGL